MATTIIIKVGSIWTKGKQKVEVKQIKYNKALNGVYVGWAKPGKDDELKETLMSEFTETYTLQPEPAKPEVV